MITPKMSDLCRSGRSVTSELEIEPSEAPGAAAHRLFGASTIEDDIIPEKEPKHHDRIDNEHLKEAFQCGNFGQARPSDLFLKAGSDQAL